MAIKKSKIKHRTAKRIKLTEMLKVVEAAYDPDGVLERSFAEIGSEDGKIPTPALTDDTLAEFLIREMGSVFNHRAGRKTNLNSPPKRSTPRSCN